MNPCPCGNATDPEKQCTCTPSQIARYKRKLSGPIMDRIDLHIEVPRLKFEKVSSDNLGEKSATVKKRVTAARLIQKKRFEKMGLLTNSEMDTKHIREFCPIGEAEKQLLKTAIQRMNLSPRGYHRLLKVARTIADLAEEEKITLPHIAEAINYRIRD
jgi:magnesium chelatase family protein